MSWFKKFFSSEKESYRQFNEWCKTGDFPSGGPQFQTANRLGGQVPTEDQFDVMVDEFNKMLNVGVIQIAHFNGPLPATGSYKIENTEISETSSVNALHITSHAPNCELIFKHLTINICAISWGGHSKLTDPVIFENCEFVRLTLDNDARVCLKNCKIGTLEITKAHQIHMEGGCVLNIQVAAPGNNNPLTGSVNFANTFFPRNKFEYLLASAQPYRNMRHHLRAIENGHMANLFHSAELAVERADDPIFNKLLSYLYEKLSDFGSSALRPLMYWFGLLIATTIVIYVFDGAIPAFDDKTVYIGWRHGLIEGCEFTKASYLSFRSMINPLGLFGTRELIIPANGKLMMLLSLVGLTSVMLITLFILAVRRRFKMQL